MAERVALVTGAGRRVGRVVALELAQAGYSLAIHYNRSADEAAAVVAECQQIGVAAQAFAADLRSPTAPQELIEAVHARWQRLDVLVCTAASFSSQPLEAITAAHLQAEFETNTRSTFLLSQLAGLQMVQQAEGGNIVTIGDWAIIRPYANYAAYFLSKGAIPTLTATLAIELAQRNPNVRVNCIHPGPVLLPPEVDEAEAESIRRATLVQRLGRPEHIAHAVRFFLENDFVTGVCLPVDGGRTLAPTPPTI